MSRSRVSQEVMHECRRRLQSLKQEMLNRVRSGHQEFAEQEKGTGDEIDQTMALLAENNFLASQERLRRQLLEVEFALMRIQNGSFGICEETQEPIESERLLALPFTRLSIEGAEIRESSERRFAR